MVLISAVVAFSGDFIFICGAVAVDALSCSFSIWGELLFEVVIILVVLGVSFGFINCCALA